MNTLITPEKVAELAFRAPDFITPGAIPEATILAAQQRFVRPVLGGLYDALCTGCYPDFMAEYIVPPLALYVKMLMMPSLAVQSGTAGVVRINSAGLAEASDTILREAVRRLRSDASALMRRAIGHVEANPSDFPEYDPRRNILKRRSIDGGIVL